MAFFELPTFGPVGIENGSASKRIQNVGDFGRSFSHKLRSDSPGDVTVWSMTTIEYSLAEINSIVAELTASRTISPFGDFMGGVVPVTATGIDVVPDGANWRVSFELHSDEAA